MNATKPLLRGHFHQALFFVSLGACSLLILRSSSGTAALASSIYTMGVLTMFGVSALYHRITWTPKARAVMKRLDHSAIYVMIAGTFTPVCLLALSGTSGRNLLIAIWAVAFLGILQSLFFINLPKFFSALLYLFAGYMIAPYVSELLPSIGLPNLLLLIGGGVAYSIGAICYALKRPVLSPLIFGYHEVFHLLVGLGAILHFAVIYTLI
jgi:hemolysin III